MSRPCWQAYWQRYAVNAQAEPVIVQRARALIQQRSLTVITGINEDGVGS
jgi:hypothetical protein